MYPPGQEEQAANDIKAFWESLDDGKIFSSWDWWYIEGLLFQYGLFNNAPFVNTVNSLAQKYPAGFKRRTVLGMTDINSGNNINEI
jgi:hypothetical protein